VRFVCICCSRENVGTAGARMPPLGVLGDGKKEHLLIWCQRRASLAPDCNQEQR